ncbi:MAG: GNAT family N-acetyltransferase [Anaerolineae bacterium]
MEHILTDLNPRSLAFAVEQNLYDVFRAYAQRRVRHFEPDVSWVITTPAPWPSYVYDARFDSDRVEQRLRDVVERMRAGFAPPCWTVGPSTQPQDLGQRLERHGLSPVGEALGMAVELARLREHPVPPGLEIVRVRDTATLRQWAATMVEGMSGGGEGDAQVFFDLIADLDLPEGSGFYLGLYEGQPVATSALYLSSGVAGINHVVTLAPYRNRGIGKQITLAPLRDARDRGYRAGILQASALGAVIYRQIGFLEYCRIGEYALTLS